MRPPSSSFSLFGRNRVHGPALALAREHEALETLLRDLRALSAVSADALRPEIGQESTRVAFYVGAHVPGVERTSRALKIVHIRPTAVC
jgi:hypothetical protein